MSYNYVVQCAVRDIRTDFIRKGRGHAGTNNKEGNSSRED